MRPPWCTAWLLLSLLASPSSPRRHRGRPYDLTLGIRNHNVTNAAFFRLVGVDNTADFRVAPGETFIHTFHVQRKGFWTLVVEFTDNRYAMSPRKIISRDSFPKWVMEVYSFPHLNSLGFSEWHKLRGRRERQLLKKRRAG